MKNQIYTIGFMFRPITPVAFGLAFLVLTIVMLVVIILNLNESTKLYGVLLSVLTGITASLLIVILMELYNNYRFNTKRQRELREYFRIVSFYENSVSSIVKITDEDEDEDEFKLGNGRTCAVFWYLNEIIPCLRKALNNRDYLYKTEIDEIDDILYHYNFNLIKILKMGLFGAFLDMATCNDNKSVAEEDPICDYPTLLAFLEKEAAIYHGKEKDAAFYAEVPKQLEIIIEKAIFVERYIFKDYFEVTDARYELVKSRDHEDLETDPMLGNDTGFEFRSNVISNSCGNIDKAMSKLRKKVAKEPFYWLMASNKVEN